MIALFVQPRIPDSTSVVAGLVVGDADVLDEERLQRSSVTIRNDTEQQKVTETIHRSAG